MSPVTSVAGSRGFTGNSGRRTVQLDTDSDCPLVTVDVSLPLPEALVSVLLELQLRLLK